jgi:hypothetical protein
MERGAVNDQLADVDRRIDQLERVIRHHHRELEQLLAKRRTLLHYQRLCDLAAAER